MAKDEKKEPSYGGWDWSKNSLAVIACRNGEGSVLWWVGGHIDFELSESGMVSLGDLGLDNAPEGISVWDGVYVFHEDTSYFDNDGGETEAVGDFRVPTDEEWEHIKRNECPWDANEWMEAEYMQVSIGRIVHYYPTTTEFDLWTKDGNIVGKATILPAMVVAVDDEESKVNLRVFLDGGATPWVTSREQGQGAGKWDWPPRV